MRYDLNMKDAEWWEKEDLDLDQNDMDEVESRNQKAESNKIFSIEKVLTSPWVEENIFFLIFFLIFCFFAKSWRPLGMSGLMY